MRVATDKEICPVAVSPAWPTSAAAASNWEWMDIPHRRHEHNRQPLSSLDIAWSYSRSNARIGSELPAEPSFVEHYRPRSPAEASHRTSYADDEDQSRSDNEEHSEQTCIHEWPETLPPNASSQHATPFDLLPPVGRPSYRRLPSDPDASLLRNELTALLPASSSTPARHDIESYGTSPPDDIPFARRANSFCRDSSAESVKRIERVSKRNGWSRGTSSDMATLFNLVNVLLGISILALPKAIAHAGWVLGLLNILFAAGMTSFTAHILSNAVNRHPHLISFTDIIVHALGPKAKVLVNALVLLELTGANVALLVLSSDNLSALFPTYSPTFFKLCSLSTILPCIFVPFRILSYTSLMGFFSILLLIWVIYLDGSIKHTAPGSLSEVMPTTFAPKWTETPLSFGVIMAGFAGHAIVPALYRDMKHPQHFSRVVGGAWMIVAGVNICIAVAGYLMFGDAVSSEVSEDLLSIPDYPQFLNKILVSCMAVAPLLKFALTFAPFYTVMEAIVGLGPVPQPRPMSEGTTSHIRSSFSQRRPLEALSSAAQETVEGESRAMNAKTLIPECGPSRDSEVAHGTTISDISLHGRGSLRELVVRVAFKCAVAISLVAVAILWPDFERVVGLLGSLGAISVCIIVPLLAEMGMRWKDMSHGARCGIVVLLVISIFMAVSGTFVALIPKTNSEK